jgi:hypothetical protein
LAVVAVAPGAAAPSDGPSQDAGLDGLFEERTAELPVPAGRVVPAPPESRVTTINLSGAVTPV